MSSQAVESARAMEIASRFPQPFGKPSGFPTDPTVSTMRKSPLTSYRGTVMNGRGYPAPTRRIPIPINATRPMRVAAPQRLTAGTEGSWIDRLMSSVWMST